MSERENIPGNSNTEPTIFEEGLRLGCISVMVGAWFGLISELEIILNDIATRGAENIAFDSVVKGVVFTGVIAAEFYANNLMERHY